MKTIILTEKIVHELKSHGELDFPYECCGFILGKFNSAKERMEFLEKFLDSQASGWRTHIITDLRQEKITIHESGESRVDGFVFAEEDILLAGAWVDNEYVLADAAVFSGRMAGRSITKIHH